MKTHRMLPGLMYCLLLFTVTEGEASSTPMTWERRVVPRCRSAQE